MKSQNHSLVALTQGKDQPSTRFRWSQHLDHLSFSGFEVTELDSQVGAYAPASKLKRPTWLIASILENAYRTYKARNYDLRFLQRNLTATLSTWEPFLRKPYVFDVDDAIFLGPRGGSANAIAGNASLVICGNVFLANHFDKYAPVSILPTAVDSERFSPLSIRSDNHQQTIGWSGSSSGYKYVYAIEPALKLVLMHHPNVKLKIVSDKPPLFKTLPPEQVLFEKWTASREVDVLREFSVGIMPLEDDLWARGKCSFKMLTYMSVGIPVVVSPIGMNNEILSQSDCGFGPKTNDDWFMSLSSILKDDTLAEQLGKNGRMLIESQYSKKIIAPKLAMLLHSLI